MSEVKRVLELMELSELERLLKRGPIGNGSKTVAEAVQANFREMCLWAQWVDDLEAQIDRYWREALRVRAAWMCAACGWVVAVGFAFLWWKAARHG